uniref:Uncharacterized protein n=1 Tax=Rhodosorus marinus TaxID=101924 RepID=A0A7S2ZJK0_9RHOD|mmetsp:Transcript_21705/g.88501  ORF Transcript_21705/g.88501 Transcript_21705/m.88501 type:complete len:311 (+) Transcript_21705:610-1542(+)
MEDGEPIDRDDISSQLVKIFRDVGWDGGARWSVLIDRLSSLLQQCEDEENEEVRKELNAWIEICSAQQAISEMRMMEAMGLIVRTKKVVDEMLEGNVSSNLKVSRIRALGDLVLVTRQKAALYFMPALASDATGFCGRPNCQSCTAAFALAKTPPNTKTISMETSDKTERIAAKNLIDESVSRCGLFAFVVVLNRESVTQNRRGFNPPESLFNSNPSESRGESSQGLCLWPALVVRPSKALESVRRMWPTVVSLLQMVERNSSSTSYARFVDPLIQKVLYSTHLESGFYAVAILESSSIRKGTYVHSTKQ